MEQTKQKLTHLIETINELFPDENDLKGFPGISKALITDSLTQSNALLISLKEYDDYFETIILKRELSELFERIGKELHKGFENIKPAEFNSLLKDISRIKFFVKETYISVTSGQPIRTDAEIIKGKEELALLSSNIEDLKKINIDLAALKDSTILNISDIQSEIDLQKNAAINKINSFQDAITILSDTTVKSINDINDEIKVLKESAATVVADLEAKQRTSIDNDKKIGDFVANIETQKAAIEIIQKNTIQWEIEINKSKDEILSNLTAYNLLSSKSKSLQTEIETAHEKIFGKTDEDGVIAKGYLQETEDLKIKIAEFLSEQNTKFNAQFNEIEGLLPGATSTGLAEAYQIQKLSYKKPLELWSWIFIIIMIIMTGLSIVLIYFQFVSHTKQTLDEALISLLKDLPFFIPTIWLASYASKQQSQYKRLQQEYAFKETNAKSFHGHKMQIEALMKDGVTDKDLLSQLVAQLVIITSQNPSITLDSQSHDDSPPVFKLAEKLIPSFAKSKKPEEKA